MLETLPDNKAFAVTDPQGEIIDYVYEAAGNPASFAKQLARIIIEHKGQVSEDVIQKFVSMYLEAINAYTGDNRYRLTKCEETGAIILSCGKLFEEWAILPKNKRPVIFPPDLNEDVKSLR